MNTFRQRSSIEDRALIRGGGEMGSGVAWRLHRCGFDVLITEIERPTAIRRWVCFAEAVYDGHQKIEGITAVRVRTMSECQAAWERNEIAVMVSPDPSRLREFKADVLIDAVLAKRNTGVEIGMARRVIGLGPGFVAGDDVDCVIETNRGPNLGRVIWQGQAERNTGVPGELAGETIKRVLRAPGTGVMETILSIGDEVNVGDLVARIGDVEVCAKLDGIVRGLMRSGLPVTPGVKIGDIDPRNNLSLCGRISDKALAIGGGVLEAIFSKPPSTDS
jgi:xanthine dehydrogenase accessory factor